LSDFVDDKLTREIGFLTENMGGNLQKICFRGFPVGKMAEYDFTLETKFPYSSKLSIPHKDLYSQYVKNTALAIAITDRICERYNPSLFLTFNEYAQCQAVRCSAKKHGIRRMALTYPVHFNIDASKFSIWETTYRYWIINHCQAWNKWKDKPIGKKDVAASWDDSVFRMYSSGSHIFSPRKKNDPAEIFDGLQLDSKRKTIIVYTSSQDELAGSEVSMKMWNEKNRVHDVFKDQIEWLRMLRDYAAQRNNIQIVVRVHPREGSRQLGFDSQHLLRLRSEFKKNTTNFIIIWPDNPISSYDLMELADVCLVSWSLVGQEAARLGVPVLSCVSNMFYPDDDFIQIANTRSEYKRKLDSIIYKEYRWEELVKATRFYHWRTFIPSLDLSESVDVNFDDDTVWPKAPASKVSVINNVLSGKQDLIRYNISKWCESLTKSAIQLENMAMKKGIRVFLDKVYFPPLDGKANNLLYLFRRRLWREVTGKNLPINKPQKPFRDYHLVYT
jgi:hypothetical protein